MHNDCIIGFNRLYLRNNHLMKRIIMAQVSMTVRMDSELKMMFDSLCAQFGMSANTAMNVFAKAVVQRRSIPFEIKAIDEPKPINEGLKAFCELREVAQKNGLADMSLEEINEEIRLARAERKRR